MPNHMPRALSAILLCVSLCNWPSRAENQEEKPDDSQLTLERIFDSGEFNGSGFSARWMRDEDDYLTWKDSKTVSNGRDLVRNDAATGNEEIMIPASHLIPPGESSPLRVSDYELSQDQSKLLIFTNTKRVWRANTRGDYWVLDRTSRELRQLGGDAPPSTLMFAKFSPDAQRVAYVRANDIYMEDLRSHEVRALTTNGSDLIINGTFDWVYEEEFRLRDGFRWSPDSAAIVFWQFDTSGVRMFPLINNTDALYPTVQWFQYPKVGEVNAAGRVGVIDFESFETVWLNVPGDPRNHYIHDIAWPEHLDRIVVQQLNRRQNTNLVMLAHPRSGAIETILTEHDRSWVDAQPDLVWDEDDDRFIWLSDRTGWRHAYAAPASGRKIVPITQGEFDVVDLEHFDEENDWLYFIASPDDPTQRYLFRDRVGRDKRERLTPEDQPGTHSYRLSSDGRWAIHTFSTFDEPPVVDLVSLPDHEVVRVLEDNQKLRDNLAKLELPPVEFFRVDIGEGVELDGWCLKPPDFDPERKYPLLIHVYGEPAGQTVLDRWGGKGMLWHRLLAQQGYVVMSFDNRGTPAPRGWEWRKSVYGRIGILGPEDQAAALRRVLEERPYLDPERVGIWGWSGGGSSTLHAMFKYPELYRTGIAIAGVPNQRYYDTIYQERYMGLPPDNVEGFEKGSSINYAKNLEGNLLIIHGTGDDNVHYQGAEALINELILHGKQFEMMSYPNRSHGISEGQSTTMHLRRLMTDYLHEHLPPGARGKE